MAIIPTPNPPPVHPKPLNFGLPKLQSDKSSLRLEQVASLRARGIGDHVDLPQLVVCGDQSVGKSSVLEGVTGLPFPRQDGVCTKFPTEIILEHSEGDHVIAASILPAASRDESTRAEMLQYNRQLKGFNELSEAIADAGTLMKIRGFGDISDGPAFAEDVLRIKVSGPTGLHLTVVDLPGLIEATADDQNDEDKDMVHRMVDGYLANPRTIVLAVVQAGNDIANQSIIQKSRKLDKEGQRTVGIITKPDLINKGTEGRIAKLAKNQDTTRLKHGFFLLCNPNPMQMAAGMTGQERQDMETKFFFKSSPWKEQRLSADRVGIAALRAFLQNLLDEHIERELPKVREDIRSKITETENELHELGPERSTTGHLRMFVTRLATRFQTLVGAGLRGDYQEADAAFFGKNKAGVDPVRLRALVHHLNTGFSDELRENGQKRKVVNEDCIEKDEDENRDEALDLHSEAGDQTLVSEQGLKKWIRAVYVNSRGRELPGSYNHILLSELFHVQSSRWYIIAENHVETVHSRISAFVTAALTHVTNDTQLFAKVQELLESALATSRRAAAAELAKLWEDERHQPITYNHYFTDNVQRARESTGRARIQRAVNDATHTEWRGKQRVPLSEINTEQLQRALQQHVEVDMDEKACAEALDALDAYYKVARKTFVDNVCRQVVERHLLRGLADIFCPNRVAEYPDEELERIAAETPANVERRRVLMERLESLRAGFEDLRR